MTFLVHRVKAVKDLILDKLDSLVPKLDELQPKVNELLQYGKTIEKIEKQATASAANESSLLMASIHLVETIQQAEHDRLEWQKQMLNQLSALHRQGIAQKEWQQQMSQQLETAQAEIKILQQKIDALEKFHRT